MIISLYKEVHPVMTLASLFIALVIHHSQVTPGGVILSGLATVVSASVASFLSDHFQAVSFP